MTSIAPRVGVERSVPRRAPRPPRAPARSVGPWRRTAILALAVPVLGAVGLGGAPGSLGAGDRLAGPLPARVVSVLDGDTLDVRVHIWLGQDLNIRVRLAGIDAPELKGKCSREKELARRARAYLLARLDPENDEAAAVRLREVRYGKFAGRVLARVETLDGADLGQGLVAAGLARAYDGRRRASWCEATGTASSG